LWLSQPREVLGLTLRSLGYSANSESPTELEAALERLQALPPNARWLDADIDSLSTLLESGEVVIGMGYAGDVLLAREATPAVEYILPNEGALLWGESFVVPANSPRQETAELFLNFILLPDIAAQIANENYYATPNEAAFPLIQPEIFNDPVVFPPNEALQHAEIVLPLSPAGQELHDQIWAAWLATVAP
jgi:spermidine/putrescine transport system substrate-binding protein